MLQALTAPATVVAGTVDRALGYSGSPRRDERWSTFATAVPITATARSVLASFKVMRSAQGRHSIEVTKRRPPGPDAREVIGSGPMPTKGLGAATRSIDLEPAPRIASAVRPVFS